MAEWSMEQQQHSASAAAWVVPYDLELANWTSSRGPAVLCSTGFPLPDVDYFYPSSTTEKFGNCLVQTTTSVPPFSEGGGWQQQQPVPVEYAAAVDVEHDDDPAAVERQAEPVFVKVAGEYKIDIGLMKRKIHRYPASIQALGRLSEWYTVPMVVSIGPYHHRREHLRKAEKVKHLAAIWISEHSEHSGRGQAFQEMYSQVVQVANDIRARSLYDNDALLAAGISHDDFLHMMFFDACFLVQYMLVMHVRESEINDNAASDGSGFGSNKKNKVDYGTVCSFFDSYDNEIFHDIMLLENQIPWPVVQTVINFVKVEAPFVDRFIESHKACLQDRKNRTAQQQGKTTTSIGPNYQPHHLLGLLRYHIVGRVGERRAQPDHTTFSISAVELAEIGVTLKPSETTELVGMVLKTTGTFFAELSLPPLSLDSARASYLINMAALELCTSSNFHSDGNEESSAVCSYLLLLAMLVDREEDVQELRTTRLLQGGGGLNDGDALQFFTCVQSLRLGIGYVRIMNEIEEYREKRRTRTGLHAFVYKNIKIIAGVISAIVTLVSILATLISLRNN